MCVFFFFLKKPYLSRFKLEKNPLCSVFTASFLLVLRILSCWGSLSAAAEEEAAAASRSAPPTGEPLRELFQQLTLGAVRGAEALGCHLLLLLLAPCGRRSAHTSSRLKPRDLERSATEASGLSSCRLCLSCRFHVFNLQPSPAPTSGSTLFVSPKHARSPPFLPSARKPRATLDFYPPCAPDRTASRRSSWRCCSRSRSPPPPSLRLTHDKVRTWLVTRTLVTPFCRYLLPKRVMHARRAEIRGQLPADLQVSIARFTVKFVHCLL